MRQDMINPITLFEKWYEQMLHSSGDKIPGACCLSTTGLDGFPNARFVSLKEIVNDCFIITGPMTSRKGLELQYAPKAALTFWWPDLGKQIRIQGNTSFISPKQADHYFTPRNQASKIVNTLFKQGNPIKSLSEMENTLALQLQVEANTAIPRPDNWGGIALDPIRIEFMKFQHNRLHHRRLFVKQTLSWTAQLLQP